MLSDHRSGDSGTMSLRDRSVLAVLCGAIFLEGIDVAMLNVAIPSIRAELGVATETLHWLVSAYVVGYGGFMLLGGRTADLLGRRRLFIVALVVFLLFSGLGGLSTEGWQIILARFVTGVAAAFMAPAGLSLVTTTFSEGPLRNKALLVYSGTAAAGFALGLVVGGLLTLASWRWVFFAPVLLAALLLAAAVVLLPADPTSVSPGGRFDVAGAIAITGAMLLTIYGVTRLGTVAQSPSVVVVAFSGAAVLVIAFLWIETRVAAPLVRFGVLATGSLVRANLVALLFAAGFFGFQFLVTLYLQDLLGWTALQTSLALLVVGSDAILSPTLTPRLVNRYGNFRVIVGGLVLAAVAYALFLRASADWTYAAMAPTMVLLGLAFSLAYGPLTIAATDGVADHEQGLAGGLLYTAFQFGAALGLSTVAVVLSSFERGGPIALDALRAAFLVPLTAVVAALLIAVTGLKAHESPREPATSSAEAR
jgi:MFS family permease